jgi:tripartite-type tricarboxylate transporter receptor subunit TctC
MKTWSRALAHAAIAAVVMGAGWTGAAKADAKFPDRPVRIVLPFGPGGVADVTMRLIAQKLSERMGQNFFIENRPGAGGIVGAKTALSYPADGYTFYLAGNGTAISQSLFKSLPYDIINDFVPVAFLAQFDMLLASKADTPNDTVQKVVAFSKANPGKLNFGTVAPGSTQNLSAELFKQVTGANVTLITYKTTPELATAVVRGDIDVAFDYLAAFRPSLKSQQIKIIATGGADPHEELPGVPTVKSAGYDYEVASWNALNARTGTPPEVIAKVNAEINAINKTLEVKKRMTELGMEPLSGTPEQLRQRMLFEIKRWSAVIDKAGIPRK